VVCKNLLRRRTRSLLTMAGIAIGIAAVVALASIAWGFQRSWERAYTARGTDMIVTKVHQPQPDADPVRRVDEDEVAALPGVRHVSGLLSDLVSIEDAPTVLVFGWEREGFLWDHLRLVSGRWPAHDSEKTVVIGAVAADLLKKKVGDPIQVEMDQFHRMWRV